MINAFDELSSHLFLSAVYGSCTQSRTSGHGHYVRCIRARLYDQRAQGACHTHSRGLGGVDIWAESLLYSEGGGDEDYSRSDGIEAEDDSTGASEDHDAEEQKRKSLLRTAVSGVGSFRCLNSAIYLCLSLCQVVHRCLQ